MAKKNNSKSIRLSDEDLGYIEAYQGNGFNEKFENLILHCMTSEKELDNKLNYLKLQIKNKQTTLEIIASKVSSLDITVNAIFNLSDEVNKIQRQIAKLLDDS